MPQPARSLLARVRSYGAFLGAFLRAHKTIGAIAPTSRGVARRIAALAGVAQARSVAELGPGTGAITRELLTQLPSDGLLCAFEVYPPFLARLRESIDDPRFTLVAESAEHLPAVSDDDGETGFDAIVSSIPFSLMSAEQTTAILRASGQALRPGGVFVALQYHPGYLLPFLRRQFGTVERRVCLWNVPPALLLRASDPLHTE